jgi:hypothetical protein
MRKGFITIAAVTMMAAAAFPTPTKIVEEDFEGSQFPPRGWGKYGLCFRTWEGGNYYADCDARSPYYNARIWTYTFALERGTRIKIKFRYRNGYEGSEYWWHSEVELIKGYPFYPVWSLELALCRTWGLFDYFTEHVTETRTDYRVMWEVACNPYNGTPRAWLSFDDVLVTRDALSVEPTSLGRVRALYR